MAEQQSTFISVESIEERFAGIRSTEGSQWVKWYHSDVSYLLAVVRQQREAIIRLTEKNPQEEPGDADKSQAQNREITGCSGARGFGPCSMPAGHDGEHYFYRL